MTKRIISVISTCIFLTGCSQIDTMKEDVSHLQSALTESSSTSSIASSSEALKVGIVGSKFGLNDLITDVQFSTEPNAVSIKFIMGDMYSLEETLKFVEVESESEYSSRTVEKTVICKETIKVGTIGSLDKVLNQINSTAFNGIDFNSKDNTHTAIVMYPIILKDAPKDSYVACKSYCETLYVNLAEEILKTKRRTDSETGIIYHNIGGDEFNLAKYRYQVRSGETAKIEILDIPSGFNPEDVLFRSDRVGYATVSADGTITGRNNGTAIITVSLAGASVYRTVYVQVY